MAFAEIRQQFVDQLKSLEHRSECQVAILGELYEFFKRRADLDAENAKQLEKMARQLAGRNRNSMRSVKTDFFTKKSFQPRFASRPALDAQSVVGVGRTDAS